MLDAPILPVTELADNNLSAAFSLVNIKVHLDVRLNKVVSDINRSDHLSHMILLILLCLKVI